MRVTRKGKLETVYGSSSLLAIPLFLCSFSWERTETEAISQPRCPFPLLRVYLLFSTYLLLAREIPARSFFWDTEIGLNLLGHLLLLEHVLLQIYSTAEAAIPNTEGGKSPGSHLHTLSRQGQLFSGSGFISH